MSNLHKYRIGNFVTVKNFPNKNETSDCLIQEILEFPSYLVRHEGSNSLGYVGEDQIISTLQSEYDPWEGIPKEAKNNNHNLNMSIGDGDSFDFETGKIVHKLKKETFPTGAVRASAEDKPELSQLDNEILTQTARVLGFGAKKYSRGNWRKGIPYNRCLDSLLRHVLSFKKGETNDEETGLPHLAHAACNIQFLLRYEKDGRIDLDDRDKDKQHV